MAGMMEVKFNNITHQIDPAHEYTILTSGTSLVVLTPHQRQLLAVAGAYYVFAGGRWACADFKPPHSVVDVVTPADVRSWVTTELQRQVTHYSPAGFRTWFENQKKCLTHMSTTLTDNVSQAATSLHAVTYAEATWEIT